MNLTGRVLTCGYLLTAGCSNSLVSAMSELTKDEWETFRDQMFHINKAPILN